MKTMILWTTCGLLLTGCDANQGQSGTAPVPVVSAKATCTARQVRRWPRGRRDRGQPSQRQPLRPATDRNDAASGGGSDRSANGYRQPRNGQAVIPFYFGGDAYRIVTFYKNQGRLEFAPTHFAGQANTLVQNCQQTCGKRVCSLKSAVGGRDVYDAAFRQLCRVRPGRRSARRKCRGIANPVQQLRRRAQPVGEQINRIRIRQVCRGTMVAGRCSVRRPQETRA